MKVILLQDVRGKGKKDEIIEVAGGYGMHLIREKKAIEASKGGVKVLDQQAAKKDEEQRQIIEQAKKDKEILEKAKIVFQLKIGKDDKAFNSISHKQIMSKVLEDYNIKLDKRKFKSSETINRIGTFNVDVELAKGVIARMNIIIKEQ